MTRIRNAVSLFAVAVVLGSILWLARLQASGPLRTELELPGGIPATLYLPAPAGSDPNVDDLGSPPAVVLAHGFASDQAGMSILARALTQAGYAVLTLDFRGHGGNRNRFSRVRGPVDSLQADMRAAVDFLRASPDVDGSRISVMGHSMGAGAALEYAGTDPALDAAVMISGGWRLEGPNRPSNALFIYGQGDPPRIRESAARIAAEIAGWERMEPGVVAGDFAAGTAVSQVEVARADHITILGSQYAARRIIDWLDDCYGVERGTFFLRSDPRLQPALLGLLAFALLLPGLGDAVGRIAPRRAERSPGGVGARLGGIALALLATLPLVAVGDPARLLPLAVGNTFSLHLFAAGVAMLAVLFLTGELDVADLRAGLPQNARAAALGIAAIFLLLAPFGAVGHMLGLTPERAVLALGVFFLVVHFQLVFHDWLRRGGTLGAAVACTVGRALVVGVLVLAVAAGVLSGVVMLMLPVLVLLFVLFEVVSSAIYARSRNTVVPALLESAWLAWILAAVLPVSL